MQPNRVKKWSTAANRKNGLETGLWWSSCFRNESHCFAFFSLKTIASTMSYLLRRKCSVRCGETCVSRGLTVASRVKRGARRDGGGREFDVILCDLSLRPMPAGLRCGGNALRHGARCRRLCVLTGLQDEAMAIAAIQAGRCRITWSRTRRAPSCSCARCAICTTGERARIQEHLRLALVEKDIFAEGNPPSGEKQYADHFPACFLIAGSSMGSMTPRGYAGHVHEEKPEPHFHHGPHSSTTL